MSTKKKLAKKSHMTLFASVLTPQRASYFSSDLIKTIENAGGANPVHRQMGNIINDLRIRGQYEIVDLIRLDVDAYNEHVDEHNAFVEFCDEVNLKLKRFKGSRARWSNAYSSAIGSMGQAYAEFKGEAWKAVDAFSAAWSRSSY